MKSRQIVLVILASLATTPLCPARAGAENAVHFTDTTVLPGDRFTVDIIIENDVVLGGAFIPFRWSSVDLHFDSLVFVTDRFQGGIVAARTATDRLQRTSGILLSTTLDPGRQGSIPVGEGPVAQIHFTTVPDAADQYAFVDSVNGPAGSGWFVQLTTFDGTLLDATAYPGTITIGHPAAVTMRVSPAALSFRGEIGGLDPRGQVLSITSSTGAPFDWSAQWNSTWLNISPPVGKAPTQTEVTVDLFVLDQGLYYDTITVESPRAENSPIRIPVTLRVDTASSRPPVDLGFELFQNHPNPFVTYHDPETEIRYYLKDSDHVQIRIYDVMGRPIRTLLSRYLAGGDGTERWDGRDQNGIIVPSGHYFYRMTTSKGTITKPMVVIK
jgi:hypothetical protein